VLQLASERARRRLALALGEYQTGAVSILAWTRSRDVPLAKNSPRHVDAEVRSRFVRFILVFVPLVLVIAPFSLSPVRTAVWRRTVCTAVAERLWVVQRRALARFGRGAWLFVLGQESSRAVQAESNIRTQNADSEIEAHKKTDEQLQKAKERAESANVAKTRYVVGITHELRTPLNAIFGYARFWNATPRSPSRNWNRCG